MSEIDNNKMFEEYSERTHVIGRLCDAITLILLVGAPFVIGIYLGAMPSLSSAARTFLAVGLVWAASGVVEYLVYTPMLGAGGSYLAFITGNLINLKIPCAVMSRDMAETKIGTPENEIISTISIATSSLATILVIAAGVALLIPLQPVLSSPALRPAFEQVVPALFGAMAYKYFRGNMGVALPPLIMISLAFCLVPALASATSFMIMPCGALAIGLSWLKYRKNK